VSRATPVLRLRDVGREFDGPVPVRAVAGVTVDIAPGEFVSVVGRSGSGKTTLLSIMGLLDSPDSGVLEFEGRLVSTLSEAERSLIRRERIGFVFQRFHLVPHRTVEQNLGLALLYTPHRVRERKRRVDEAIEALGLESRRRTDVSLLSGGEQQRVAMGRALVGDVGLLLCDEPTGNLDSATGRTVMETLRSLNSRGVTVVVVTHDPVVAEFAQRQLTMKDGRLV